MYPPQLSEKWVENPVLPGRGCEIIITISSSSNLESFNAIWCVPASSYKSAESNPNASFLVVTSLTCSLKGKSSFVYFANGSNLASIYGTASALEAYHCSYGMNPDFERMLLDFDVTVSAKDENGSARAIELISHPFFVATLFQPERAVLSSVNSPLVDAFVASACHQTSEWLDSDRSPEADFV